MIRAVIFDCFEVLLLHASGHFLQKHVPNHELVKEAFEKVNELSDYGRLSYEERLVGLARATGLSVGFVRENLYKDLIRNDDLFTYIETLRGKYKVGLLSNTGVGSFEQFFTENELQELFDVVVLSYQVGIVKPDPEIYRLTARDLGCSPEECVMVDDSQSNCDGAMRAGMKAMQYEDFTTFRDEFMGVIQSGA